MSAIESSAAPSNFRFDFVDATSAECIECVLQLTRRLAFRRFAHHRDREDRVNDSMSLAWEFAQKEQGTPATVAHFAIRRVASNGQFSRSRRSIDHNQPSRIAGRKNAAIEASSTETPVSVAMTRVDFESWLSQLPSRLERVARLLASGLNTVDAAEEIGCTRGNISGIRQQLIDNYQTFRNRG